jgi:hypothetical protein
VAIVEFRKDHRAAPRGAELVVVESRHCARLKETAKELFRLNSKSVLCQNRVDGGRVKNDISLVSTPSIKKLTEVSRAPATFTLRETPFWPAAAPAREGIAPGISRASRK